MARNKIDYGIDLGTTNSAISRMEKGKAVVIKTDVQKDTMPSCVSVNKKGTIKVGDGAYNVMKSDKRRATKSMQAEDSNTYIEFKRTMGTDTTYPCRHLGKDFSSEQLSSEVLKTLKSFVTDEGVQSAVITVPAKFTVNQKTATLEAAKLAGLEHCQLLQEPIAAAMAYGLSADEKDGLWMVFDFGGGTFDAALLRVEDGIMQVFDTEGDNYLGGKNLDYAIVDEILLPYLRENYDVEGYLRNDSRKMVLRDAMKTYAEEVKNQLSFKEREDIISNLGELGEDEEGEEMEIDLSVTQDEVFAVMRPYFQKAVDICLQLLQRNHLSGDKVTKLILVGGPTHSPLIREMLRQQVTPNVDTHIDPMTAVATGAALYASTLDAEVKMSEVSANSLPLKLGYEATTVETSEWVSLCLDERAACKEAWVEIISSDGGWSSGKVRVDTTGDVVEVMLKSAQANRFSVTAYDHTGQRIPCFPDNFTIIQGTKVGAAVLPYNIGIDVYNEQLERLEFKMCKGLEKNKRLPAVGVASNLWTRNDVRPGKADDGFNVRVYQTDDFENAEGRPAFLFEYVADASFTGKDVDVTIPRNSELEITLRVDASEQIHMELHFLEFDLTLEKVLDTSKKQSVSDAERDIKEGFAAADKMLKRLHEIGTDTQMLQHRLAEVRNEAVQNNEKKMVLQHLKEVLRDLDKLDAGTAWQQLEKELDEEFERLERAQKELGNAQSRKEVEELRQQKSEVEQRADVEMGRAVLERVESLFFRLTILYQTIAVIRRFQNEFSSIAWKDTARARQLLKQALEIIEREPKEELLVPIAKALIDLAPYDDDPFTRGYLEG